MVTDNRETSEILQRAADGGRISPEEALLLYTEAPFHALGEAADTARRRRHPDGIVTYIIDRNINYTNVCVTACKFCAFYRAPKHEEGWSHPMAEILRRCGEAVELGATQVMLQGGHHPDYGVEYYEELFSSVKAAYPQLVIHSIGPSEIIHMARVSGVAIEEALRRIRAAGLDSIAGAGAEMLPARPRTAIAPLKESGERWLAVMEIAHGLGIESTATMMMGTGETNAERIEHIRMIRDVQDRTGGLRAFIPWTYQPEDNHLKGRIKCNRLEELRLGAVPRDLVRPPVQPGPAQPPRHPPGPGPAPRRAGPGPGRRHRRIHPGAGPFGRQRGRRGPLAGHAARRSGGPSRGEPTRRGRAGAAVPRRRVRRGDHLLRAAQRPGHRGRPARTGPGHPTRWPAGHLRVQPPDVPAAAGGVPGVPDAGPAAGGPHGGQQPRRVRLPRRVHPRVARPGRTGAAPERDRLDEGGLAQPDRRDRRAAPGGAAGHRAPLPVGP